MKRSYNEIDASSKFKIIQIKGDGNCFFRCIAYYIYNDENKYEEVRKNICYFMKANISKYSDEIQSYYNGNINTIEKNFHNMITNGTYAEGPEIHAASENYQIIFKIFQEQGKNWLEFYPFPEDSEENKNASILYLQRVELKSGKNYLSPHYNVFEGINEQNKHLINEKKTSKRLKTTKTSNNDIKNKGYYLRRKTGKNKQSEIKSHIKANKSEDSFFKNQKKLTKKFSLLSLNNEEESKAKDLFTKEMNELLVKNMNNLKLPAYEKRTPNRYNEIYDYLISLSNIQMDKPIFPQNINTRQQKKQFKR